jgi:hypothetical protein
VRREVSGSGFHHAVAEGRDENSDAKAVMLDLYNLDMLLLRWPQRTEEPTPANACRPAKRIRRRCPTRTAQTPEPIKQRLKAVVLSRLPKEEV